MRKVNKSHGLAVIAAAGAADYDAKRLFIGALTGRAALASLFLFTIARVELLSTRSYGLALTENYLLASSFQRRRRHRGRRMLILRWAYTRAARGRTFRRRRRRRFSPAQRFHAACRAALEMSCRLPAGSGWRCRVRMPNAADDAIFDATARVNDDGRRLLASYVLLSAHFSPARL